MPKARDRQAGDEGGELGRTWKPSFPAGRYLGRKEAAATMWAVIDLMAHGTESIWHGVESWDQAKREGIVEWYERQAQARRGELTDDGRV